MYIEYRSYFLFNRFLPNSCILTRENVRFSQKSRKSLVHNLKCLINNNMYIEYRSYFLFNRFLPNSCILTRENVRFF